MWGTAERSSRCGAIVVAGRSWVSRPRRLCNPGHRYGTYIYTLYEVCTLYVRSSAWDVCTAVVGYADGRHLHNCLDTCVRRNPKPHSGGTALAPPSARARDAPPTSYLCIYRGQTHPYIRPRTVRHLGFRASAPSAGLCICIPAELPHCCCSVHPLHCRCVRRK